MKSFLLSLFLTLIFSCKDKSVSSGIEACGVKDPIRNLPWLRSMIDDAKSQKQENILTITVGRVNGETIFEYYLSYMSCIGCILYRCDGTRLDPTKYQQEEWMELVKSFRSEGANRKVIWPQK